MAGFFGWFGTRGVTEQGKDIFLEKSAFCRLIRGKARLLWPAY